MMVDYFKLDLRLSNGDWFIECFDSFDALLEFLANKSMQYSDLPFACQCYITTIFKGDNDS